MAVEIPEDVLARVVLALKEFAAPDPDEESNAEFIRISIPPHDMPVPALAKLVLVSRGAAHLPRGDKTAWEVAFRYAGVSCLLALQKFGLRLYVDAAAVSPEEVEMFASQLVGKVQKGVGLIEEPVLRPLADAQLREGNVTIANQVGLLRGTYEHFCKTARAAFTIDVKLKRPKRREGASPLENLGIADVLAREMNRSSVGAFNALAAINAYFSLLEHTLVLVLPFTEFNPQDGALATFIGDRWGEKVKKVFDVGNDPDASRQYNRLHMIAETYRNTYSHGGFDKGGAAVWVHLPEVGAIPASLSDIRDAPHFELFPVDEADFDEITRNLAEVDDWLRSAKTKYGMRFAEAGLDVAYDDESRARYSDAMQDDARFEEFIEATARIQTDLANLDF